MGKVILLCLILFLAYQAWKWYKEDKKPKSDRDIKEVKEKLITEIRLLKIKAEQGISGAREELIKSESDLKEINELENKLNK
jgi:hypothetical protein